MTRKNPRATRVVKTSVGSIATWGLVQELQKAGAEVIGIDCDPLSFAFYLLKRRYVVPKGSDPRYVSEVMRIVDAERPAAILSGTEEELLVMSYAADELEKKGTLLLSPESRIVKTCMDKKLAADWLRRASIPIPEVYEGDSARFPCAVKPRVGRGSRNAFRADDRAELSVWLRKVEDPIIQEFVSGDEYSVDILADKNGDAISVVPRLRLYTESGISVKSKTVFDPEIIDYCTRIAKGLRLFGPSCVQCIKGADGPKFTDINMRFGGGSILSIKADPTIIPNLLRLIRHEEVVKSSGFKRDLVMLRYHSEVFVDEKRILRAPFGK